MPKCLLGSILGVYPCEREEKEATVGRKRRQAVLQAHQRFRQLHRFCRASIALVLSQGRTKESSLHICALISQSLDADYLRKELKSWVRQFSSIEEISKETNSSKPSPAAGREMLPS